MLSCPRGCHARLRAGISLSVILKPTLVILSEAKDPVNSCRCIARFYLVLPPLVSERRNRGCLSSYFLPCFAGTLAGVLTSPFFSFGCSFAVALGVSLDGSLAFADVFSCVLLESFTASFVVSLAVAFTESLTASFSDSRLLFLIQLLSCPQFSAGVFAS